MHESETEGAVDVEIIGPEIEGRPGRFRAGRDDSFPVGTAYQLGPDGGVAYTHYVKVEDLESGPHWECVARGPELLPLAEPEPAKESEPETAAEAGSAAEAEAEAESPARHRRRPRIRKEED